MALSIQEIINEADLLVANGLSTNDKVPWLNAINQEFFDVVKIPQIAQFTPTIGTKTYTLLTTIKEKNIDKVMIGHLKYRSLNYEDVQPKQNWFTYTESNRTLTLSTAPSKAGDSGIVRYYRSATTTFTTGNLGAVPDAPDEYHWIYVLGLAEYIAKAIEEDAKAANYGGQYRNALQVAAQNYKGGVQNAT
ncbi:hypothetical protein DVH26_07780 [Paenibacillus sp. H1-7]|uniref:phage adaptor protein n=1 Tax=Paenibacillus sp. H1-7 TaxID=2282849 RepID=UPI001EF95373|nr:hypothetical protein [Paenibacillus sp. H1-7]ULL14357.1 hypothetical protein DVH26_07780 [Paenibacillus sp. H1-7]